MEKLQRLFDMGMTLESTPRQLKNGTYVLHSSDVKTTYSIYTNLSDGTIKRISYHYDLQHHSQDGKISNATPGMSVEEAIPHLLEQYNKYYEKHTTGCHGVKDGEQMVYVVFSNSTNENIVAPPQELLDQVFTDTQLIVNEHSKKKVSKVDVTTLLNTSIYKNHFWCVFYVKPLKLSLESWAQMCETILKEFGCTAKVFTMLTTREGLCIDPKNYSKL